ncbi:MAG: peptide chain release factor-like protein [Acidobacteria bacterium]|nr:peptide chain release factor-like protein [Acidobacteriota bacterium]
MVNTDESIAQIQVTNFPTDRESLERDCDVEFFVAGGPGGQHRNKVETGVRLTHRPSGLVVTATERRSQSANREAAFERMAEKLEARQRVRKPRRATKPTAASKESRRKEKKKISERKQARSKQKTYED